MMQNPLEVALRQEGQITVIDLKGDLTERSEKEFETVIKPCIQRDCRVVMNFSGVGYINSSGIALLIAFITALQSVGGRLRAYGLSPHFRKIFEIVGLAQYIEIVPDEALALGSF